VVSGWLVPADQNVQILDGQVNYSTATYTAVALGTGAVRITIQPAAAITAGAQWRRVGTTPWFASGATELNVTTGTYSVEFKAVAGWNVPVNLPGLVVQTGLTTLGTGTYTSSARPGAPGNYKVTYKGCQIFTDSTTATHALIVTDAQEATIKIQKLTKLPKKTLNVAGKTLYIIGSPSLDSLTAATGTIKSLTGTGAFIPTITANLDGTVKMGVLDGSFAAPFTSILPPAAAAPRASASLNLSLSGVTLDALDTSSPASIKIGAKKVKGGVTVPAGVASGALIQVGAGLSLAVTNGNMLADLVESTAGIKSLSVKAGNLGETLTSATLATFLTPAAVAVVGHPSTVFAAESTAGIGKVSAGTLKGVFVAGADVVGKLLKPNCGAAVKSWKVTNATGDAFISTVAKTQPTGIVSHTTAP
jgi:hypothetical protein